jgi:hypothetical protein
MMPSTKVFFPAVTTASSRTLKIQVSPEKTVSTTLDGQLPKVDSFPSTLVD